MHQSARFVVNPITVNSFPDLLNCSTHNLGFRAEIRKRYTPVNPISTIYKWGTSGYKLHGRVTMMQDPC